MIGVTLFAAGSIFLVYVSRASLRAPASHAFSRFVAWEAILALVILNAPHWFHEPFSPRQIVSWVLLFASVPLVVSGYRSLTRHGALDSRRPDATLFEAERTTALVTTGVYRYIRHPLYASLLCLAWGAFGKDVSWASTALAAVATVCLIVTAKRDEAECVRYFGRSYADYMRHTWLFVPFIF